MQACLDFISGLDCVACSHRYLAWASEDRHSRHIGVQIPIHFCVDGELSPHILEQRIISFWVLQDDPAPLIGQSQENRVLLVLDGLYDLHVLPGLDRVASPGGIQLRKQPDPLRPHYMRGPIEPEQRACTFGVPKVIFWHGEFLHVHVVNFRVDGRHPLNDAGVVFGQHEPDLFLGFHAEAVFGVGHAGQGLFCDLDGLFLLGPDVGFFVVVFQVVALQNEVPRLPPVQNFRALFQVPFHPWHVRHFIEPLAYGRPPAS
mmetsp:Transcript_14121/g.19943  ORF Transcript_14121/g.19943 Transcript_14121/m.19943 type:complete len:259 (-) Transcript_14121:2018-2794(-)